MSWTSFVYVMVILVMAMTLIVAHVWPKNQDGSWMNIEEVEELMSKFPRPPRSERALKVLILLFAGLAMIGTALTSKKDGHGEEDY